MGRVDAEAIFLSDVTPRRHTFFSFFNTLEQIAGKNPQSASHPPRSASGSCTER